MRRPHVDVRIIEAANITSVIHDNCQAHNHAGAHQLSWTHLPIQAKYSASV
ncbi:protein of unknown function [Xenorhabdus poinarii G6]|uniref:Uncharacterized protein n=1 Tax=Xenorhabdus poinarii G6 TaxID=1354304 RepID=A0A068R2Z6_9GAMM|nr:protein of unknown function [Xenorhabdus poinarii G6]